MSLRANHEIRGQREYNTIVKLKEKKTIFIIVILFFKGG